MSNDDQRARGGTEVWALTPARLVGHWAVVAALWAATVALPVSVVYQHPDTAAGLFGALCTLGFAGVAVVLAVQQTRAGTAVWIDPATHTVTVYRAAGGTLTTTPNRVHRIDRGRRPTGTDSPSSPTSRLSPLRIVTAEGTVRLSPFLGPTTEITDALTAGNPHTIVDL